MPAREGAAVVADQEAMVAAQEGAAVVADQEAMVAGNTREREAAVVAD